MASIDDHDGGWSTVVNKRKSKEKKDNTTASGGASIQHKGRSQYSDGNNYPQKILRSYFSTDRFIKFLSMKVSEVIKQIIGQIKSFQYFLEKGVSDKDMDIVLQLLLKLCEGFKTDQTNSDTVTIFSELFSSRCNEFQWKLTTFIRKMPYSLNFKESDLRAALDIYCTVLNVIPQSCYNAIPIPYLSDAVTNNPMLHSTESLKSKLDDILELHRSILEQQTVDSIKKSKQSQASLEWDNSEYRNMQVIPEWHEVRDPNPPTRLRPNIIREQYEDWMHYYDVQFRLLREDFIAPLRKGIKDYRDGKEGRNISNLRVYFNVKIAKPVFTNSGLCHEITFQMKNMGKINWEHSKRFIYGSLVCLSPDNFEHTAFFATITNREPEKLKEGKLTVMFQGEPEIFMHQKKNTLFVMAESKAYYEASSHVLRSLQLAEPTSMPFTKHLLKNNSAKVDPPKYLSICPREAISYDVSLIIKKEFIKNPKCARKYSSIKILCHEWPSLEDTDLDASQLRAMKMALTQEVVVIQGPPGTGKTFIGLKIVQALLKNKNYWSPDVAPRAAHKREKRVPSGGPILIMCFTNHALDQFLEGILDLHEEKKPSIVRVGKRSKSEKLQKYNLAVIKQHQKVPKEDLDRYYCKVREVKFLKSVCQKELSRFSDPALDFASLAEIKIGMSDHHIQSLQEEADSPEERKWALELWLGLYITKRKDPPQIERTNDEGHEEESSDSDSESEYASANSSPHESEEELGKEENNRSQKSNVINAQRAEKLEVLKSMLLESQLDTSITERMGKKKGGGTVTLDDFSGFSSSASHLDASDEDVFMPTSNGHSWNTDGTNENGEVMQEQGIFQNEESSYELNCTNPNRSARKSKIKQKKRRLVEVVKHSNYKKLLPKNLTDTCYGALEAEEIENVHGLEFHARWELYRYWHSKYREKLLEKLEKVCKQYKEACKDLGAAKQKNERYALENAHIVGMTTTGTAKYQHILHMIKPKIVIVEEAAELMESHIVSSLNAGTQHLILIGDHKQLRPKPNEYDLVEKYKLDISLFERLVIKKFPFVTLENQHRMRPEIAELVHPIYDKLNNHSSVLNYPKVKGVCKNLFLIDHSHPEETSVDLSHENRHEALYLIALCQFLLKKSYAPSQITMLATYSGQFLLIRKLLREKAITDVKITTVDNFQGEENDIILLSLVRSNSKNIIGFLKEENRVCVSLSRARHGFYCIGNFSMLKKSQESIWQTIVPDMESKGNVGTALEVHCINHPENKFLVADPEGFDNVSPEGGCNLPCGVRLKCGHTCPKNCHLTDPKHCSYKCEKRCGKKCKLGHACKLICSKQCVCYELVEKKFPNCEHTKSVMCHIDIAHYKCMEKVPKDIPRCGHAQLVPCSTQPNAFKCKEKLEKDMTPCGHKQSMMCHEDPQFQKCNTIVPKEFTPCGHIQEFPCHVNISWLKCKSKCDKHCSNQHQCEEICHEGRQCRPCRIKIDKVLPKCGHQQRVDCGEDPSFVNCMSKCDKLCRRGLHSCKLLCYEKCRSCCEEMKYTPPCDHMTTIQCWKLEMEYVCTMHVSKQLPCGHYKNIFCSADPRKEICLELVTRTIKSCGHEIEMKCGINIEEILCTEIVEKVLRCGHIQEAECYLDGQDIKCPKLRPVTLKCGHKHDIHCEQSLVMFKCQMTCKKTLDCGHIMEVKCFEKPTRDSCKVPTTINLGCGHSKNVLCNESRSKHICDQKCEKKLSCGHHCKLQCWQKCACTAFVEHNLACGHRATMKCTTKVESYRCMEPCKMKLSCGHQCKMLCFEACTDCCEVMVTQVCDQGHKRKEKCCCVNQLYPSACKEKCTKMLPCGHPCRKLCYQQCNETLCCAMVDKLYPCGHSHRIKCSSHPEDYPCDLICKYPLSCGHLCGGKCSECRKTRIHKPCQSSNPLHHFCGSQMRQPCLDLRIKHTKSSTGDKYEGQIIVCRHKEVSWKCSGEIKRCDSPCEWSCSPKCPHPKRCTKLCYEECNRDPCNEHCPRMMQCGRHRCIGLCGERCITVCPHCNISQFRHHLAMSDTYSEGEAYIQLSCGHIVSVTNMDDFVDVQLLRNDFCLLQCPNSTCHKPLSSSYRYGNVVKRSFGDISTIVQINGIKSGNYDDLIEVYLETGKVLKQPHIKEDCPKELHSTFNRAMKKVCETERPLREDELFVLFLIAKLIRFYTHQQYLLSDTAAFIVGNLERWLKKNLTRPKLSVQVIYDVLSEYYRLHLDVMITSLSRPPGTQVMDRILKKDPHTRISGKDFVTYSKLLGIRKLEILPELDQFQPRIKIGNWKKCSNGHLYCVPAVTSNCHNLKVCCPQCEGKIYKYFVIKT